MLSFFFRIFYYNCNNNFVNYFLFLFFLFISVLPTSLHYIFSYSVSTLINSQANIRLTVLFIQQMTCCPVSRFMLFELWPLLTALLCRIWTSGMETAAGGRLYRAWNISLNTALFLHLRQLRIGYRNAPQQAFCIGVQRIFINLAGFTYLYQLPQVHNSHIIGYIAHHR